MTMAASISHMRLKFPGAESLLFKDLSLSFKKGEKTLILGPSGSGKSTLLQALTGLIPNVAEVPMKAENVTYPDSWGFVFQDPDAQFCMPYADEEIAFVLENLQIPRSSMPYWITHYLKQAGLHLADNHTDIQRLSGGMKQRLAIASVLVLEPEVLFLDEPTAMLDPAGTKEVWETIKKSGKEKTVIIVEHKIEEVVDFIDRIVLLNEQGEIVDDGCKQEVFNRHRQLLTSQGIWYPGVWKDYIETRRPFSPPPAPGRKEPAVSLSDFTAYRGRIKKMEVKQADVFPGEWITVMGKNGAGKSTLLLALIGLIKTKGFYQVAGKDYHKRKKLTDYLAFVFQNPEFQFVTNSVYDELAFSLRLEGRSETEISNRVASMLKTYHLEQQQEHHPYQLSMGQKRRLSVAAAIIKEQPVLLLDEPTFGQDAKNTFAILEQLEQLRLQGTAIIMVTHDKEIAKNFATRVWQIESGKLAADYQSGSSKPAAVFQEDPNAT